MLPGLPFSGAKLCWPHRFGGLCSHPSCHGETDRTRTFARAQGCARAWADIKSQTQAAAPIACKKKPADASGTRSRGTIGVSACCAQRACCPLSIHLSETLLAAQTRRSMFRARCTMICQLSRPRLERDCQTALSISSPSLRSCGFFVKCQNTRSVSLRTVMAGVSYVASAVGKSNFIMTPVCAVCRSGGSPAALQQCWTAAIS